MQYRPEIDGLRALAVLSVIIFHANLGWLNGGFIGVDVFFVISGYLITNIIWGEISTESFSLVTFYERRVRRILPALFLVTSISAVFAWFWLMPDSMSEFSASLATATAFISNILFWQESGYFATANELQPLLHTWSLAVEEQYYVIFPLLLLLLWRFAKHRLTPILILLFLASLLLAQWGAQHHPVAAFYLLPTRIWEFLVGSFAALYLKKHQSPQNKYVNTIGSSIGLLCITASAFSFNQNTPVPGFPALIPTLGAGLIIVFTTPGTAVYRLLSIKWLVRIGLISYSAYLWHQPIFAFARYRSLHHPSDFFMLGLCLLTLSLAYLSWKYVESPFRDSKKPLLRRATVFGSSAVISLLLIAFGAYGHFSAGFPERVNDNMRATLVFSNDYNPYIGTCHFTRKEPLPQHPVEGCTDFLINDQFSVLFIGDSHSTAISYQTQKILQQKGVGSYAVDHDGCIGLSGFYRVDSPHHQCHAYNIGMLAYARQMGVKTLVITSRFPLYYTGDWFDNQQGGVELGKKTYIDLIAFKHQKTSHLDQARRQRVLQKMQQQLYKLSQEFNVVLIYPIPEVGWDVPHQIAKRQLWDTRNFDEITTSYDVYKTRVKPVTDMFDAIESKTLFRVLPDQALCRSGRCFATAQGTPLYFDNDHLANSTGAVKMAPLIVKQVLLSLQDKQKR